MDIANRQVRSLLGVRTLWRVVLEIVERHKRLRRGVSRLDAAVPGRGAGTALIEGLVRLRRAQEIAVLRVTTTNDNLSALRFYQRRGFRHRGHAARRGGRKPAPEAGDSRRGRVRYSHPRRDRIGANLGSEPWMSGSLGWGAVTCKSNRWGAASRRARCCSGASGQPQPKVRISACGVA